MNAVVERLGWALVHSVWQFLLVALLAGIVVRRLLDQLERKSS